MGDSGWPSDANLALEAWKKQAGYRLGVHLRMSRLYKRYSNSLQIPGIILSALSIGLINAFSNDEVFPQTFRYILSAINIIGLVLISVQQVANFPALSERHKQAANNFESLCRLLNQMIILPDEFKGDPVATLSDLRLQFDNACRNSPSLPSKFDAPLSGFDLVETLKKERKRARKEELSAISQSLKIEQSTPLLSIREESIVSAAAGPSLEMLKIEPEDGEDPIKTEMDRQIANLLSVREKYQGK